MAPGRVLDWGPGESDSEDPVASRPWLVTLAAEPVWCGRLLGLSGSETSQRDLPWWEWWLTRPDSQEALQQ